MSIIPGMETRAPERTDTRSGRSGSPSRLPAAASRRARPLSICFQNPGGCFLPAPLYAAHASVVMVKPGGTGTPRLVISASSHPLPPRSGRIALLPSALPFAKEYTYLGVRVETARNLPLGVFRILVTAISATPWPEPSGGPRTNDEPSAGLMVLKS